jgi:L-amino acid N-acyltransferase YncA
VLEITACEAEADELASLDVYNTVWPHDAVTIEAVHAYNDSALDHIDYLVREDGVISGSGAGAIFAYRAHRVVTLITVFAGQRRRGAGTALYEAISRWASDRGVRELEVSVASNDPESLSFAQRRGFTEERREVGLVLSLADVSPQQVQLPAGIEIVTGRFGRSWHAGCTRSTSKSIVTSRLRGRHR